MQIKAEEISEIIRKQIKDYGKDVEVAETGTIISVGDGIARIHGLDRWFSVRAEFERDASGRALRAFGVTQDITQRTLAERGVGGNAASLGDELPGIALVIDL